VTSILLSSRAALLWQLTAFGLLSNVNSIMAEEWNDYVGTVLMEEE
jgi:hypothetical protein